jgi:hypothetical protein
MESMRGGAIAMPNRPPRILPATEAAKNGG